MKCPDPSAGSDPRFSRRRRYEFSAPILFRAKHGVAVPLRGGSRRHRGARVITVTPILFFGSAVAKLGNVFVARDRARTTTNHEHGHDDLSPLFRLADSRQEPGLFP